MNWEYRDLLPTDFSEDSRVWIYQSSRLFTTSEAREIGDLLNNFVAGWNAHGDQVKGFGTLFFRQFIILMADETAIRVSGCSTDGSVRLIREMEQRFQVRLFDRTTLAFAKGDNVEMLPMAQLAYALEHGFVRPETLYFNNTVLTKQDLKEKWLIPLKESWLATRLLSARLTS
jgi:hypothetical protein